MTAVTSWRTDDPCPVCGTGLTSTDDGGSQVTEDCGLCGWSATWAVDMQDGGSQ
jgi:transcription elongation factor Elf1